MGNTNTPPPLYVLTPIDQTEGLDEGYHHTVGSEYVAYLHKGNVPSPYKPLHGWDTDGLTGYLRPLPEGTRVLKPGELDMAIEFHEWVGKQGYKLSHYAAKGEAVHLHESKGSTPFHELKDNDYCTTEELYNKFIQTKLAQMGE